MSMCILITISEPLIILFILSPAEYSTKKVTDSYSFTSSLEVILENILSSSIHGPTSLSTTHLLDRSRNSSFNVQVSGYTEASPITMSLLLFK